VLVALLLFAPASLKSASAGSDPGTTQSDTNSAQDRLDADRALAATAADRLSAAQDERAHLEATIADNEAAIAVLRTRADSLRATVRQRAAQLYVRQAGPRLSAVVNTDNVVDAARGAKLTQAIDGRDQSVATAFQNAAQQLDDHQAELRTQQTDLAKTIASLTPLQSTLDNRIEHAVTSSQAVATDAGFASADAVWDTFRECTFSFESGGNYQIVSPDGVYYGAWQFDISTWNSVAARIGRNDLVGVLPSQASPADQDLVAHALWLDRGNQPWGGRC
jgi:phage shock protein A